MSLNSRLRDAAVHRETEADDGYGGMVESDAEVLANVRAEVWPVAFWDREALVQQIGVEIDRNAVVYKGTLADGNQAASGVRIWDILRFASDERYQVLGLHPVRVRGGRIDHYSILVMEAEDE